MAHILAVISVPMRAAGDGETAWEMLQAEPYTAAIIDIALPGMTGLELIRLIRESDELADLPCVAVTAYRRSRLKQEALEAGFDAYLSKPLDPLTVIRTIEGLLKEE
jgi:CheY-like chemotaxis protein